MLDHCYEEGVSEILPNSIPAKLLSYMTGIELGYQHGLHRSPLLAEVGVVVEDETQREVVLDCLKADCQIRTGRPPVF